LFASGAGSFDGISFHTSSPTSTSPPASAINTGASDRVGTWGGRDGVGSDMA
jgi:hypothetical protein